MNTLYWINVIGNLNNVFVLALVSCLVVTFILIFLIADEDSDVELPVLKYPAIVGIIVALALTFTPSKKDLYIIYGVGGTLDYLKENKNAKQIPDKCLQVLNKYIENELEEQKK